MAANDNSHSPWKDIQDRYWQTLGDLTGIGDGESSRNASGPAAMGFGPQSFLEFGSAVLRLLDSNASTSGKFAGSKDNFEQLQQLFGDLHQQVSAGLHRPLGSMGPWSLERWAQWCGFPSLEADVREVPAALGWGRENQERLHAGANLFKQYQAAANDLTTGFLKMSPRIWSDMRARLESDVTIGSLRELYDLWIDCSESAYRELTSTDDYARRFARFVDAATAMRGFLQRLLDGQLDLLNVPNRTAFDTLLGRHEALAKKVNTLQEELAALRATKTAVASPRGTKKTKARKSTSKRRGSATENSWDIDELIKSPDHAGPGKPAV